MEKRTMKRNNSCLDDESDDEKKTPKIERSADDHQSAVHSTTQQYFPIASLKQTYSCPQIKGTLTVVSEWLTSRNHVKFLVFHLRDESGEIKGIAFDPMGEYFHKNFKLGATVILKNSKVEVTKEANKSDQHESYKLIVNRFSSIKIQSVPPVPPKYVRTMIRDILDSSNERDVIDVLGILVDVGNLERNSMREVKILDESEENIVLTLWDNLAKNFNAPVGSSIVAYRVAVRIFGSKKSLRTCHLSQLLFDPQIDDIQRLKEWYSQLSAAAGATESENSSIDNTVQGTTNNNIVDNRHVEMVNSFASTSTSIRQGNYISIEAVLNSPPGALVDIVGFIVKQEPPMQRQTKSGILRWMKTVILTDEKNCQIELAIWGGEVEHCNIPLNSVIKATDVTVRAFNDTKTLSCLWMNLQIEPNVPQSEPQQTTTEQEQTAGLREDIPNNSTTNPTKYSVAAASSRSPGNSLHSGDFMQIKEINDTATAGSNYNIIARVTKCKSPVQQRTKSGKMMWMRIVRLTDENDSNIEMNIWGNPVKIYRIPLNSVITVKNVTVRVFNDEKTLSCLWVNIQIVPNFPQLEPQQTTNQQQQTGELGEDIPNNSASNETKYSVIATSSRSPDKSLLHRGDFTPIKEINATATTVSTYNIVALVTYCKPAVEQRTKAGKMWMRTVMLTDEKHSAIEMAIWGNDVKVTDIPLNSVIMARNVIVRAFNNKKTLSCLWVYFQIEPDIPQAARLRKLIPEYTANSLHCGNITKITKIKKFATAASQFNIVAFVLKRDPPKAIKTKAGKKLWLREVTLTDENEKESKIKMAIFGEPVKNNDIPLYSVIMARDVTVKEFDSEDRLNCFWSNFEINPNLPEADKLREIRRDLVHRWTKKRVKKVFLRYHSFELIQRSLKKKKKRISKFSVIGLATAIQPPMRLKSPARVYKWVTKLILEDADYNQIDLVVFSEKSSEFNIPLNSVLVVEDAVVARKAGGDRTTLCSSWRCIAIDPDTPEVHRLKKARKTESTDFNEYCKLEYYIPIEMIGRCSESDDHVNTIGLIVQVKPPEITAIGGRNCIVTQCVLRGRTGSDIELNIISDQSKPFQVPLNSVIAVSRASLQHSENNERLRLACDFRDVEFDTDLPESKGFKEAAMKTFVKVEQPQIQDRYVFTEFEEIKKATPLGTTLDVLGLVVDVMKQRLPVAFRMATYICNEEDFKTYITRVTLRDANLTLINLIIRNPRENDESIHINSVIVARDATLQLYGGEKVLHCLWESVEVDPEIPEAQTSKIQDLTIPFVRSFMPFMTIYRNPSLLGCCSVDIIGQVVEKSKEFVVFNRDKQMIIVGVFVLKNDARMNLLVRGMREAQRFFNKDEVIPLNSIISAKDVLVTLYREEEVELHVDWVNLSINPLIPDTDRVTQNLAIVQIKRILNEAKEGDKFGLLAVVNRPWRIEDKDVVKYLDGTVSTSELGKERAMLIDTSGETIKMTMPFSVAESLRKNSEKTVVIRAMNMQVCRVDKKLELEYRSGDSSVEINPDTMEAVKLREWYDLFCKKVKIKKEENEEHQKLPITLVLKYCAHGSTASVMGILIASEMCKSNEFGQELESRRIQIIDDSEEIINLLLWHFAARDFKVPLYSIVLVRNFYVCVKGEHKWGDFGPATDYTVVTAAGTYLKETQRLESWFARYCAQSQNLSSVASGGIAEENSIAPLEKKSIFSSDDIEMVESLQKLNETIKIRFPNDFRFTRNNKLILESSSDSASSDSSSSDSASSDRASSYSALSDSDTIEDDSDSDIFADW